MAICRCSEPAFFVKALPWRERMESAWAALSAQAERYRPLIGRADLVFPVLHVRTGAEWIRVYPFWPMDLAAYLENPSGGERLPASAAAGIAASLAAALAALEAAGYVHRDLKPANVLVDSGPIEPGAPPPEAPPRIALADFGEPGVWGTRWWAAPESFDGAPGPLTPLFGLGAVIWALLARRPFVGLVRDEVGRDRPRFPHDLRAYLAGDPSPFEEAVAAAPADLWRDRRPEATATRARLLALAVAALRFDPADRLERLARLVGADAARAPAAAVAAWLAAAPA